MQVTLIVNAQAGALQGERPGATPDAIRDAFAAEGTRVELQVAEPARLAAVVRAAVEARPDAIVVAGGDGTVSTAAGLLVGTTVPLGVLPLGTLNHFARDLGAAPPWRDAVTALARGAVRNIDAAVVNDRVFVNNCSIGSYPEAVRGREQLRHEHGRGKWVAMAVASLSVFKRLRRFRLRIETPDTAVTLRTPFVFIGNNRYSGHLLDQNLRPRLDEALLSIYTTRAKRHFTILRLAWQSLVHSIDEADALETHLAPSATITCLSDRALPVAVDGELVDLPPPLRFRVLPGALRVLAPMPPGSASPSPKPGAAISRQ